jgi:hypothetical protein
VVTISLPALAGGKEAHFRQEEDDAVKRILRTVVAVLSLAIAGSANADILDVYCADDGDGAVTMTDIAYSGLNTDEVTISVKEIQHWAPAHLDGWITTNTTTTKNVWIIKEVQNDTDFIWDGYTLNVYRMDPFSITGTWQSTGWLPSITPVNASAGSYTDGHGQAWSYKGVVNFEPIDPSYEIAVGASGDFGAKISFAGSTDPNNQLAFMVEQIPIPEPATLVLLSMGGLLLRRRR